MPKGNGKPIPRVEVQLEASPSQEKTLLSTLKQRFEAHMERHPDLTWEPIQQRLESQPAKLASLHAMEASDGEPDVIGVDPDTQQFLFCDCAEQSPTRRSICYDEAGEQERIKKDVTPGGNAVALAKAMGIELLDEAQYHHLQTLGAFDTKTESWLKTPQDIRDLGGALFGNRRYNRVFIGYNSAPSFYSSRGFRGVLRV